MPTKRKDVSHLTKQAHSAAHSADTRGRIRDLTVRALRERDLGRAEISGLVHDVLEGVSRAVDDSIPATRKSVLREVFDGLGEAIGEVSSAGAQTAKETRERARTLTDNALPVAAKRVRSANDEFLRAVRLFAKRTSAEVGEELESLTKRAKRTGGRVATATRGSAKAADGRLVELGTEAARAGVSVARRTAGGIVMAASGMLEGLGEVVSPRRPGASKPERPAPKPRPKTKRKAGAGARKKTKKTKRKS
jgi:hypothetical protein